MKAVQIILPEEWQITYHNWYEHDEDQTEDLFQAKFRDYLIDVGFYSDHFTLYVIKGDFLNGVLIDKYKGETIKDIQSQIDRMVIKIPFSESELATFLTIKEGLINGKIS